MAQLTMKEIKQRLYELNKDIIITSNEYISSKEKLQLECLICDTKFTKTWNGITLGGFCPCCGSNGIKISKQEIIEHVEKYGYKIVNFVRNDNRKGTVFNLQCSQGHPVYESSYRVFNRFEPTNGDGKSCKICSQEGVGSGKRRKPEEVQTILKEAGYTVDDNFKYTSAKTKHDFKCSKGHIRHVTFKTIVDNPTCYECEGIILQHTEETIIAAMLEIGLEYISGYENIKSKILYKCKCGETDEGYFPNFKRTPHCKKCSGKERRSLEGMRAIFAGYGCILLDDESVLATNLLNYKCSCGEYAKKHLYQFLRHPNCPACDNRNPSGEDHPMWISETTEEERIRNRKYKEYDRWRKQVYERDNYTCQCCGNGKEVILNAHHLDGYEWAIDLRVDLDNGITLCKPCHMDFHKLYGYNGNTREQYEEYIEELYENLAI